MKIMIYIFMFCCKKYMISGNVLVIGGKTPLTYFLQTFLIILKNVYSLVFVMIF